jgi:hypothetical protein
MLSNALKQILQKRIAVAQIIWAALLGSIFLYLFVAYSSTENKQIDFTTLLARFSDPQVAVFAAISCLALFASVAIPNFILRGGSVPKTSEDLLLTIQALRTKNGQAVYSPQEMLQFQHFSVEELQAMAQLSPWMVSLIVGIAFSEMPALLGFICAFESRTFVVMLPFALASAVMVLTKKPSVESYIELLKPNARP